MPDEPRWPIGTVLWTVVRAANYPWHKIARRVTVAGYSHSTTPYIVQWSHIRYYRKHDELFTERRDAEAAMQRQDFRIGTERCTSGIPTPDRI